MITDNKINDWYSKNTKLYKPSDLKLINNYISIDKTLEIKEISISNDYKFKYISTRFKNIRCENIFKLNWMLICEKLIDYFPKIKIDCLFEASSYIDSKIQKGNATFKHDVYISINDKYDCAIEFFEEKSHKKKSIDTDKELYSQQVVDQFIIYKENEDNDLFFRNTIHKILLLICASNNDHYTLSKINFFKNNMNNPNKLRTQTQCFNRIINYHRKNKFHFKRFFNELAPLNLDSEEKYKLDEFINFLEEEYSLIIILDEKGYCEYNVFASMILLLDINITHNLKIFKQNYLESMTIMIDSQKEIITYINDSNNKKRNLPEFLDTFLKNHVQNYCKPYALKKAFNNLSLKFME
jgi:hypothetical protein